MQAKPRALLVKYKKLSSSFNIVPIEILQRTKLVKNIIQKDFAYYFTCRARGFARIEILLKRIYYVTVRNLFQVTGKNVSSTMKNYNPQTLKA